ncbi:MAG: GTPase HflX [Chloroflexi bacterium]|nr:GTPase HflX [Chloroflexota bacterium]NOG62734.1 GTPase HflX [Chloroflexota bacterium]
MVGIELRGSRPLLSVQDSLEELKLLADTAGMVVVGQTSQRLNRIVPGTFIGPGKVEEIKETITELPADVVIFDDELSPRHQRELEEAFGENIKVLDRSALILDIFAQHATTHEGRLQVELAQYEYRLPRLTRQWTHLARQAGGGGGRGGNAGVGLRGPGETQLEVDRREVGRRISKLKVDLENVRGHRQRQRQQREKAGLPVIALVGYTNAGKSTLLNTLTGSDIYVANQLFATLDPTTRKTVLPGGKAVLFSDTVGFIQKLPTTLIAAFQATLEGITEADLLLHVVDATHPNLMQQIEAVEDTLAEIDVPRIPKILVLNKIDMVEGGKPDSEKFAGLGYSAIVGVSALEKMGIQELLQAVEDVMKTTLVPIRVLLPYSQGELLSWIHTRGVVDREEHTQEGVLIEAHLPARAVQRVEQFCESTSPDV